MIGTFNTQSGFIVSLLGGYGQDSVVDQQVCMAEGPANGLNVYLVIGGEGGANGK